MQRETCQRCSRSARLLLERPFLTSAFCCEANPSESSRYQTYSYQNFYQSNGMVWKKKKKSTI